mmetsp:Transcript_26971/g.45489  ORF Transcript_26971/g.45489 Transcript_26971/m.45489 type:complete len:164 (-) Transcript_26971:233-724(-)
MMQFSLDSAFYVFNLVSNWAYSRWDAIYADVYQKIIEKESVYFDMVQAVDREVSAALAAGHRDQAVEMMTKFSTEIGDNLLREWFTFFGELFVKYRDGYVTTAAPAVPVCGCETNNLRYNDAWYDRIVEDTGDHYLVPPSAADDGQKKRKFKSIPKNELRAFQ